MGPSRQLLLRTVLRKTLSKITVVRKRKLTVYYRSLRVYGLKKMVLDLLRCTIGFGGQGWTGAQSSLDLFDLSTYFSGGGGMANITQQQCVTDIGENQSEDLR